MTNLLTWTFDSRHNETEFTWFPFTGFFFFTLINSSMRNLTPEEEEEKKKSNTAIYDVYKSESFQHHLFM